MCRLFPCIPIFRCFFLLKVQKECVYVIMLKLALVLFKIHVLVRKKGTNKLVSQVAAKPSADLGFHLRFYFKVSGKLTS